MKYKYYKKLFVQSPIMQNNKGGGEENYPWACAIERIERNVSGVGNSPSSPVRTFPSSQTFSLPLDRPRPRPPLRRWLRSRLFLTLLLAWAGCNRFPEARAHYRPVGLAITCEASFDFVCASQHSFRLSTRPSEILRGSFQRVTEERWEKEREREKGKHGISRETAVCVRCCCCCCLRIFTSTNNTIISNEQPMIITGRASSTR